MISVSNYWLYERHWPFEQILPSAATADRLAKHDVVVLAPKGTGREPWVYDLVGLKAAGKLPRTHLVFGTYYGRDYREQHMSKWVTFYVVHCSTDITGNKDEFIPLALTPGTPLRAPGKHIFVGGRKTRDFIVALNAIPRDTKAVFVSDFLPELASVPKNVTWIRERIPLNEYKGLIDGCFLSVVPVVPGPYPHGHSDVVRSLLAGKPVVVTRGASCDDYVDGQNGILADYCVDGFRNAIRMVKDRLPDFTKYCEDNWARFTPERFLRHLIGIINFRCGTEYVYVVKS